MIIDCDVHAEVREHADLLPYMSLAWRKHFERDEWLRATNLVSSHVRMSDAFGHAQAPAYLPVTDPGRTDLVLPPQGLAVNGWADHPASTVYLQALNSYADEHWASPSSRLAIGVSPHDRAWSAAEIRRRAGSPATGAVAMALVPEMLGSSGWDPVYDACVETGLPLVIHYSGVEGLYLGAAPLSGGVHRSALARLTLMPHLAESNVASLVLGGAFARFPGLRVLLAGFGFSWLPPMLWRLDREWRTFRADVPWVTAPPSEQVAQSFWFTSHPLGEAAGRERAAVLPPGLRSRIVFGSHFPYGADSAGQIDDRLGPGWAEQMMSNGAELFSGTARVAR